MMNSLEAIGRVIAALEALSIEYALVGAFSSNAYGVPRSTKDADISETAGSGTARAAIFGPFSLPPSTNALTTDRSIDRRQVDSPQVKQNLADLTIAAEY